MNKLSELIVHKRYIILTAVLAITVVCAILFPKVEINYDMTKYLSDESQMKQGLDIMEAQFPDVETSNTIRVMVDDLTDSEKTEVLSQLEGLKYADSVTYEADSEDYNKDNHTLYIVNTGYDYNSPEEVALRDNISEQLSDYEVVVKNDDTASDTLPLYIIAIALALIMIVLFAMCSSWIEPLLFLAAIGIAVIINLGTNYFLGSISNVTFMIAALLQLVLSMDYSIMLMNRYRQELEHTPEKNTAMIQALRGGCSSIAGSAVTTIVGLLVLVFMSFKIGMDLGIVLAKGVLISLLSVFTVLPCFILMADNLIKKTPKKALHIPTGGLARFSHRFRFPIAIAFIILFIGCFFLRNGTPTAFTLASEDPIADVFPTSNQIVLLYENDDEDAVTAMAEELEADANIKSVTGYSTSLGKPQTVDQLAALMADMGSDTALDADMLKIIYYDYYCHDETVTMTMSQFLHFIHDDVMTNETFASEINFDMAANMDQMIFFADSKNLTTPKNSAQLAKIFGMDEDTVEQLLLLYYSSHDGVDAGKMTLPQFTNFILNEVSKDPQYSSMFDSAVLAQLNQMAIYTDAEKMTTPYPYTVVAQMLGMDENTAMQLFMYYAMQQGNYDPTTMPLPELSVKTVVDFIVANQEQFAPMMGEESIAQLTMVKQLIDLSVSGTSCTPAQMAQILGMNQSQVRQLYLLYQTKHGDTSSWKLSVYKFVCFLQDSVLTNKTYAKQLDSDAAQSLSSARTIMDAVLSGKSYTPAQLTNLLSGMTDGLDENTMELLALYYGSQKNYNPEWTLSIHQLFEHLSGSILNDSRFASFIDDDMRKSILDYEETINDGLNQLQGKQFSRLIITTTFPAESKETSAFIKSLFDDCDSNLSGDYYLVGNSVMTYEMENNFDDEMLFITWLTAISIFVVVAVTFKSLIIPLILVLLVQCGVYLTVTIVGLQGYSIYYLALLIVQSILMGATIDYAILFSNYYREKRQTLGIREALTASYKNSIHTIMTSGLILTLVCGIVGRLFENPTIGQICTTISTGALCACLLILFILPGILAATDRLTMRKLYK